MAVTNQRSTQASLFQTGALEQTLPLPADDLGRLRVARFDFAQAGAGDAGSDVVLVMLPPGRKRVYAGLSRVAHSAFGAGRTLAIGLGAYTQPDGTDVAAATNSLHAAADVAAAGGFAPADQVGDDETMIVDSLGAVEVKATVAGGTIPDAATLEGAILFVHD